MSAILEIKKLTKEFPGVRALSEVDLEVQEGEIHALVGENGAGKSTLMKVLCGLYPTGSYDGDICIDGQPQQFHSVRDSEKKGLAIIFQELMLFKDLSIAENIFVGDHLSDKMVIDWEQVRGRAQQLLDYVKLPESPDTLVGELGVGKQQMVEIMKALAKKARILILDEPTAALTDSEVEKLLGIIRDLKKQGVTCIYISHRLGEVLAISDMVTILKDGQSVGTYPTSQLNEDLIVSKMVGREMSQRYPEINPTIGPVKLKVNDWTVRDYDRNERLIVDHISFEVRRGEILGIAGLMGAGRTELVSSLFGINIGKTEGEIFLDDARINIRSPIDAIRQGICLLTEDRKKLGINFEGTIQQNIAIQNLHLLSKWGVIDENAEVEQCNTYVDQLKLKCSSIESMVGELSGGNQQKVVLAKLLMSKPGVLFLDEPTRGIDVGAKYEIYTLMNRLLEQGMCIVMISSDLQEVLGMSHRVMIMKEGRVTGIVENQGLTEETIMKNALEV